MPQSKESMVMTIRILRLDDGEGYNLDMDLSWNPEDRQARQNAQNDNIIGRLVRSNEDTPADVLNRIQSEAASAVTAFNNWVDNYDTNYP